MDINNKKDNSGDETNFQINAIINNKKLIFQILQHFEKIQSTLIIWKKVEALLTDGDSSL